MDRLIEKKKKALKKLKKQQKKAEKEKAKREKVIPCHRGPLRCHPAPPPCLALAFLPVHSLGSVARGVPCSARGHWVREGTGAEPGHGVTPKVGGESQAVND